MKTGHAGTGAISTVGKVVEPEKVNEQDAMAQHREPKDDMNKPVKKDVASFEGRRRGKLDPGVQAKLGATLRSTYQALIDAPVPARFLMLLERLEQAENKD